MRLVLAHEHDVAARELTARWGDDAVLLTPADLHEERMLLRIESDGAARAEIPSRPEVTSVLIRLGGVGPADLRHVDPQDLTYAAAELDAFLRAWLDAWRGPVVNRPSTTCLNGPGWRPEHWAVAASAHGLDVRPVRRPAVPHKVVPSDVVPSDVVPSHAVPGEVVSGEVVSGEVVSGEVVSGEVGSGEVGSSDAVAGGTGHVVRVTVVGDRWFGSVPEDLGVRLCGLAAVVGCRTLEAVVDGEVLVQVSAWPDVSVPDVADAIAGLLDGTS